MSSKALIELRNKRNEEIYNKKKEILELEKSIKDIDKRLWEVCDHIWVRIPDSGRDLIKKRCEICGLGYLPSLYK